MSDCAFRRRNSHEIHHKHNFLSYFDAYIQRALIQEKHDVTNTHTVICKKSLIIKRILDVDVKSYKELSEDIFVNFGGIFSHFFFNFSIGKVFMCKK